jgi:hypothetical protein
LSNFKEGDLVTFYRPHRKSKATTPRINGVPADQLGVFIRRDGKYAEITMSFSSGRSLKVEIKELRKV